MRTFFSITIIVCLLAGYTSANVTEFSMNVRHLKYYQHNSSGDSNGRVGGFARGGTGGYSDEILCYAALSLDNATINSVTFKFYVTNINTNYYTCTADLFEQNKADYNATAQFLTYLDVAWSNCVGSKYLEYDKPSGWYSISTTSLKNLVQDWADDVKDNEGLILAGNFGSWSYYWDISSVKLEVDYTPSTPYNPPTMSPTSGTTFDATTVTFSWTEVAAATGYELCVGTTLDGDDIARRGGSTSMTREYTIIDLPSDGNTIYVLLNIWHPSGQQQERYTYTALTNSAPTDIILIDNLINENEAANSEVGVLTATDADGGTMIYSLAQGSGDTHNSSFNINVDKLQANAPLNYEDQIQYSVRIKVEDPHGLSYEEAFTIEVQDISEYVQPTVTPAHDFVLTSNNVTISWVAIEGASSYQLLVGPGPGTNDYYNSGPTTDLSHQVSGLPTKGNLIYVKLITTDVGGEHEYSYNYRELNDPTFGYKYPQLCGAGDDMKVDGNVAVGNVTDPSEKVVVDGKVKCDAVIIGDWTLRTPDYVFDKSYNLMSIKELEKYLNENQHLPEIQSAEEMKENGVDLSKLNMSLLKKIEELHLYVIQQQKEIEKLHERVNVLKR